MVMVSPRLTMHYELLFHGFLEHALFINFRVRNQKSNTQKVAFAWIILCGAGVLILQRQQRAIQKRFQGKINIETGAYNLIAPCLIDHCHSQVRQAERLLLATSIFRVPAKSC